MESVTIVFLHLYLIHEAIKIEGRTSILARECAFGRTSYVSTKYLEIKQYQNDVVIRSIVR